MKTNTMSLALASVLAAAIAAPALAAPRSADLAGKNYLVSAEDLSGWHAGAYYRSHEATLTRSSYGGKNDVSAHQTAAFIGHDITPWITVYGVVGYADTKVKHNDITLRDPDKGTFEYGVGAWFNLIDHDMFDYLATVTRYNVQGSMQFTFFDADSFDWQEFNANLTFGLTNEIQGDKHLWPDAITLFVGPTVDFLNVSGYKHDSGNSLGLIYGIDIQFNKYIGGTVSAETYEDTTIVNASVSVRF